MKKIVFITFYDTIAYGVRILSSIIQDAGLQTEIIFIKDDKVRPVLRRKDEFKAYQYFFNGLRRGSCYAIDQISKKEIKILLDSLEVMEPDLICLSTRSFAYSICKEIFPKIKKRLPDVPILSGGWGPTLEPEKFLEFSDYVCLGEGESTILKICEQIKNGKSIHLANNLIYYEKSTGKLKRNQMLPPLSESEMDSLSLPDFLDSNKYFISKNQIFRGNVFQLKKTYFIFAGRGCPFSCTYCMSGEYTRIYKKYSGKPCPKYRLRSIDVVIDELKRAKESGAGFIKFADEVFPIRQQWIEVFLKRYGEEINLPFFAYIRPEFHSPEVISALRQIGLSITAVGIQSGSSEIRKKVYKRKLATDKVIQFANVIKDNKIDFAYHFLYENPFENEDHLKEQFLFVCQLPYSKTVFMKLQVFPNSPIEKMLELEKPAGVPQKIGEWYIHLQSLALVAPFYRKISKFIFKYKLFRQWPAFLTIFHIIPILKEPIGIIQNRLLQKGLRHYFPAWVKKIIPGKN